MMMTNMKEGNDACGGDDADREEQCFSSHGNREDKKMN